MKSAFGVEHGEISKELGLSAGAAAAGRHQKLPNAKVDEMKRMYRINSARQGRNLARMARVATKVR